MLVYGSQKNTGREGVMLEYENQHCSCKKGFGKPFHELLELL